MGIEQIAMFIKTLNVITGAGLIVICVLSILDIKEWITFKIFLIPCPFFVGFFGVGLIAAQLKIKFILKRMAFLKSLMGRGLFNIYLSSLVFWFLHESEPLAWGGALVLFITGIMYMIFYFGYGKKLRQKMEENDKKDEEKKQSSGDRDVKETLI